MSDYTQTPTEEPKPRFYSYLVFFSIRAAVLLAICFAAAFWIAITFFPLTISPYSSLVSLTTYLTTDAAGAALIGLVAYDVLRRRAAKLELERLLSGFDPVELAELRFQLEHWPTIRLADLKFARNENLAHYSRQWFELISFFRTPLGNLAAQALFQKSKTGRLRYFEDVAGRGEGGPS